MTNPLSIAAVMLAVGSVSPAQPRDTLRVDLGRGSEVWIEGSSNVVDWRCQAVKFDARVELAPGSRASEGGPAPGLRAIHVKVAVRDLKCGNRKMEHDLYSALGANDPNGPAFILGRFAVVGDSEAGSALTTAGELTVAGVERTVTAPVSAERGPDGALRARGSVDLLMTDFGVKPPVGLFGLIRSKNEVRVRFDLVVVPQAVTALAPHGRP
jgi:hypothetical protein